MAAGRVCTGFSKPYVALYDQTDASYSSGMTLARGVDVSIAPNSGSSNDFYADNQLAESSGGTFSDGTFSLTVDGLKKEAEKMIMGLPAADTEGWTAYGDEQSIPYVGIGFIARYKEDGVTSYVPYILCKCKFDQIEGSHATAEDSDNFQTQALSGKIYRGDDAKHNWKYTGKEYTTEALAEAALVAKLG